MTVRSYTLKTLASGALECVVPLVLNTDAVEEVDRAEYVHVAMGAAMIPVEWHWLREDSAPSARVVITDLGDLTVCSGRTTAGKVERTPRLARDATEPSVFLNLHVEGRSVVVQDGREAVLRPGDLVMHDSTAPYSLINDHGVRGEIFRIPQSALALRHDDVRKACGTVLSPGDPLTSLTYDYLRRLVADPAILTAPNSDLVARPSIDLVRAVIATHLGAAKPAAEALANTLLWRILQYTHRHLRDPDLSPERIAAAHFISVRNLYGVMADAGISLNAWIRSRRLESCRRDLALADAVNIANVARRHGYSDMSSFSRAFKAEYGLSPRDWRNSQLDSRQQAQTHGAGLNGTGPEVIAV
ncbi:MAG: helix-turn-helix domain-containing protein [Mycobacterium sp.]